MISAKAETGAGAIELGQWDAKKDFDGPPEIARPLGPWEKFAHVLLLANEFQFID